MIEYPVSPLQVDENGEVITERMFTVQEVCNLTGMAGITLRRRAADGYVKHVLTPSGRYLFPESVVAAIVEASWNG